VIASDTFATRPVNLNKMTLQQLLRTACNIIVKVHACGTSLNGGVPIC
jgi:hypothetical protein